MTEKTSGFYAYAASPSEIGQTIESALTLINDGNNLYVKSWKALDIVGHFISDEVLSGIDNADFLMADISVLNFNVTYEIGYAIGKGKRIPTKRETVSTLIHGGSRASPCPWAIREKRRFFFIASGLSVE